MLDVLIVMLNRALFYLFIHSTPPHTIIVDNSLSTIVSALYVRNFVIDLKVLFVLSSNPAIYSLSYLNVLINSQFELFLCISF